jgi:hypothetical protein
MILTISEDKPYSSCNLSANVVSMKVKRARLRTRLENPKAPLMFFNTEMYDTS